jgi:hypothetical protein
MSSIALLWTDIKSHMQSIGPGRGRLRRPDVCLLCEHDNVWYDGWRQIFSAVLIDGTPVRFDDGLWLQLMLRSV